MVDSINGDFDWAKEVKNFHETKVGVKGLVDAGITKIPKLFEHPLKNLESHPAIKAGDGAPLELPTIDFQGLQRGQEGRREVVEEIRKAAEEWGFFRIVNHGIPLDTMDAMVAAAKRFHELPNDEKAPLYSNDSRRSVKLNSHLPTRENDVACWRDLLSINFYDDHIDPDDIPSACRDEVQDYVKYMVEVREVMAELLSEALGLRSDYLSSMECMNTQILGCLYYPKCPEPSKTLGTVKHSDLGFLTLLMHDDIGGFQILHQNQWVDVPPVRGSLVANIGDLLQIVSNDKFISVEHRVLAQPVGPRISIVSFFIPGMRAMSKPWAPIKEILSDENPAKYREFMFQEFHEVHMTTFQEDTGASSHFKI